MIKSIAGSPVEGEDFFGREEVLKHLWEVLEGQDVLLLGPRRIGKTSVSRRLCERARENGYRAFEVNVASCEDEAAFVDKLLEAVRENADSLFKVTAADWWGDISDRLAAVRKITVSAGGASVSADVGTTNAEQWDKLATDLLRKLAELHGNWLIYMDELPIFLFRLLEKSNGNTDRVRRFLDWFRNDIREHVSCKSLHWLISGSVGLDTLVQRCRIPDTINTLNHQQLPPFDRNKEADPFLNQLSISHKLGLTPELREQILDDIGWTQPFFIQLVVQQLIRPELRAEADPVRRIRRALDRVIESGDDNDFHYWETRLEMQLGKHDADIAKNILTVAAHESGASGIALLNAVSAQLPESPAEQRSKFIEIRDILLRDAYLGSDESQQQPHYRFRFELLRRWWLKRNTL